MEAGLRLKALEAMVSHEVPKILETQIFKKHRFLD